MDPSNKEIVNSDKSGQTNAAAAAYSVKFLANIESELKELLDKRESLEKNLVWKWLETLLILLE